MFGEIDAAWSLWDRVKKWWNAPTESVATRFVRLFESHGVHRNQIPRFIGHGLTLRDVQDDASLIGKLDELTLEAACARFAVRREWLDGAQSQVHLCHDFYKYPSDFSAFLNKAHNENPDGEMTGVLLCAADAVWGAEALIILQETIGSVGDKSIYRYHLLNNWQVTYWKSRAYLTACVAIAWKRRVYIYGTHVLQKEIDELAEGDVLLGWRGEGIGALGHKTWYPEDMALQPAAFLKGVDPEEDNFGIRSGLELWLDLEQQGLMDTGFKAEGVRQAFSTELSKYATAE